MPRGQKSKLRAREKRHQARAETQSLQDAPATAAKEKAPRTPPSAVSGAAALSPPAASGGSGLRRAPPTTRGAAGVSHERSDGGAKSQDECEPSTSKAVATNVKADLDPVSRRAGLLVELMLYKYKAKEPITKADMMKVVNKRFRDSYSEIFKMATDHLELVFGISLKKIKPSGHSYTLVSQLESSSSGYLSEEMEIIRNGLLMPLLGIIYLSGNRASEEDIWKFLNALGIQDGQEHLVFEDPRKLITHDLVQENYLEYRPIPNSDPPRYEFLWGSRAKAEITKKKLLMYLSRINYTIPNALLFHYPEAFKKEEERVQARASRDATN